MSENISSAFIFMAVLFLLAVKFIHHRKVPLHYILSILTASIGYLTIILSPAESAKKAGFSLFYFRYNLMLNIEQLQLLMPLLAVFIILFVLSCFQKVKREHVILSAVFLFGALFSHIIMIVARYYPERCMLASTVLLIAADSILAEALFDGKRQELIVCLCSLLLLCLTVRMPVALNDVYGTNAEIRKNEAYIYECRVRGETDISVPYVYPETKYSTLYGLSYLDTNDANSWLNRDMGRYYGVNSVTAILKDIE